MSDRIVKQLKKLNAKQRTTYIKLIEQILAGNMFDLDVVKLKGNDTVFRVRKGDYRIIFQKLDNGEIKILAFEHRSETIYKTF